MMQKRIRQALSIATLMTVSTVTFSADVSSSSVAGAVGAKITKAEVMHVMCPNGIMATSTASCSGMSGSATLSAEDSVKPNITQGTSSTPASSTKGAGHATSLYMTCSNGLVVLKTAVDACKTAEALMTAYPAAKPTGAALTEGQIQNSDGSATTEATPAYMSIASSAKGKGFATKVYETCANGLLVLANTVDACKTPNGLVSAYAAQVAAQQQAAAAAQAVNDIRILQRIIVETVSGGSGFGDYYQLAPIVQNAFTFDYLYSEVRYSPGLIGINGYYPEGMSMPVIDKSYISANINKLCPTSLTFSSSKRSGPRSGPAAVCPTGWLGRNFYTRAGIAVIADTIALCDMDSGKWHLHESADICDYNLIQSMQ